VQQSYGMGDVLVYEDLQKKIPEVSGMRVKGSESVEVSGAASLEIMLITRVYRSFHEIGTAFEGHVITTSMTSINKLLNLDRLGSFRSPCIY
jgi:hypothetical protein